MLFKAECTRDNHIIRNWIICRKVSHHPSTAASKPLP